MQPNKKERGQFYTTNANYILDGFAWPPPEGVRCIIEPFAGKGDLIAWVKAKDSTLSLPMEAYDIEPKSPEIQQRDTLRNPPNYENAWIITNPPYLARNKCKDKELYSRYNTNDLYKCFISSVVQQPNCRGGIFIVPAGFFFSPREMDVCCRGEFMKKYRITRVNYFEESVFEDTSTTIAAFSFESVSSPESLSLTSQNVLWTTYPSKVQKTFLMSAANHWIIGGDIYNLPIPEGISIRRHVEGHPLKETEQQTFMTLNALDSGKQDGRICLTYKKDVVYPAKDCSRTYATLRLSGKRLSEDEQIQLCQLFNEFLEQKRSETWGLFLPQFRESKEYARKRIPFELAYRIVLHLIHNRLKPFKIGF